MIAKSSVRVAGGSFGRLVSYVSDLSKIGDLRDWQKTADYILDSRRGGGRVAAIRVSNCFNDEPPLALAEIAAIQVRNTTSKTDKTYHLIVSFPPGETPAPAQLHDIEDTLCAAIGLAAHQRISAVHNDTAHFHFHVAINKVHPETLRAITPYFDQARLQAACLTLEAKHGLTPTNHAMPERGADRPDGPSGGRAEAMAVHGGQESLKQWVRDVAGPALLKAQESGRGWQDLHEAAATYGLEVKPRGAGLVIAVVGDKFARVKPSDIDRRLTFGALTDKWGAYQAPAGPQPPAEHAYPRAPLHTRGANTADLFGAYQRDRTRSMTERATTRVLQRTTTDAHRAEWAAWSEERRRAIKVMPYTAEGRRAALAEVKRTRDAALVTETARRTAERKQATASPLPTWQGWLQTKAAEGNTEAADVLRTRVQQQAALGAAVLSAANADEARHVVYQHLRPSVNRDGSITYRVADGGCVTDQAKQIRVDEVSVAATYLALSLALDRFGNAPLAVTGTDAFKAQLVALAAKEGWTVRFADPAMEAARQAQVAAASRHPEMPRLQMSQLRAEDRPEVAAFVSGRNATRERVSDIRPYRVWTPADAGEAIYAGRRQIAADTEVVLSERAGETLVKAVSPGVIVSPSAPAAPVRPDPDPAEEAAREAAAVAALREALRRELRGLDGYQLDFATGAAKVRERDQVHPRDMTVADAARLVSPGYAALAVKADTLRAEATQLEDSIRQYEDLRDHHQAQRDERWRGMGTMRQYGHRFGMRPDAEMSRYEHLEKSATEDLVPLHERRDELATALPAAERSANAMLETVQPAAERKLAALQERAEVAQEVQRETWREQADREREATRQRDLTPDNDQEAQL